MAVGCLTSWHVRRLPCPRRRRLMISCGRMVIGWDGRLRISWRRCVEARMLMRGVAILRCINKVRTGCGLSNHIPRLGSVSEGLARDGRDMLEVRRQHVAVEPHVDNRDEGRMTMASAQERAWVEVVLAVHFSEQKAVQGPGWNDSE